MTHHKIKFIIAGIILTGAIAVLAISGISEGWVYFLPVDEFLQESSHHDRRVRLHGSVGEQELVVSAVDLQADFSLQGKVKSLQVSYHGVIPDQFQAGRDVVVEGRLDEAGIFQADTLLTKCASKYQSADGQAPHKNPRANSEANSPDSE